MVPRRYVALAERSLTDVVEPQATVQREKLQANDEPKAGRNYPARTRIDSQDGENDFYETGCISKKYINYTQFLMI